MIFFIVKFGTNKRDMLLTSKNDPGSVFSISILRKKCPIYFCGQKGADNEEETYCETMMFI